MEADYDEKCKISFLPAWGRIVVVDTSTRASRTPRWITATVGEWWTVQVTSTRAARSMAAEFPPAAVHCKQEIDEPEKKVEALQKAA